MPKPKTVSHVVEVDRVEDLPSKPENVKEAVVSGVKYKRHRSYDGGTYWAAEDVKIPRRSVIYIDVIIGPGVKLPAGIKIGMRSTIGAGTKIGPGTTIGESVNIGENCNIGKGVDIDNGVQIDYGVTIANGSTISKRAHIKERAIVKGVVGEKAIIEPEEYYNTTESEQEEEDYDLIPLDRTPSLKAVKRQTH